MGRGIIGWRSSTYDFVRDSRSITRQLELAEIATNDFNLNITRYVSTAEPEVEIDLAATHKDLVEIEAQIQEATARHNAYLKELGLPPLPGGGIVGAVILLTSLAREFVEIA